MPLPDVLTFPGGCSHLKDTFLEVFDQYLPLRISGIVVPLSLSFILTPQLVLPIPAGFSLVISVGMYAPVC